MPRKPRSYLTWSNYSGGTTKAITVAGLIAELSKLPPESLVDAHGGTITGVEEQPETLYDASGRKRSWVNLKRSV